MRLALHHILSLSVSLFPTESVGGQHLPSFRQIFRVLHPPSISQKLAHFSRPNRNDFLSDYQMLPFYVLLTVNVSIIFLD